MTYTYFQRRKKAFRIWIWSQNLQRKNQLKVQTYFIRHRVIWGSIKYKSCHVLMINRHSCLLKVSAMWAVTILWIAIVGIRGSGCRSMRTMSLNSIAKILIKTILYLFKLRFQSMTSNWLSMTCQIYRNSTKTASIHMDCLFLPRATLSCHIWCIIIHIL